MTSEQYHMFLIESCAMQQISIDDLSEERESVQLAKQLFNNTATSDGAAQKLENDVWRDSESIATKVCCQIGSK